MNLIVVGILLLKLCANLTSSVSQGITIICFKYDSDVLFLPKMANLNHLAIIFIIPNNLFFQNIDKIDCKKIKEELMEGGDNGGYHLGCNPKGRKCGLK